MHWNEQSYKTRSNIWLVMSFPRKLPWPNPLKNINRGNVIHYLLFKVSCGTTIVLFTFFIKIFFVHNLHPSWPFSMYNYCFIFICYTLSQPLCGPSLICFGSDSFYNVTLYGRWERFFTFTKYVTWLNKHFNIFLKLWPSTMLNCFYYNQTLLQKWGAIY